MKISRENHKNKMQSRHAVQFHRISDLRSDPNQRYSGQHLRKIRSEKGVGRRYKSNAIIL